MNNVAAVVTKYLKFNMMRILYVLLNIYTRVSKSFFGFASRSVKTLYEGDIIVCGSHTPTTAARDRFDHDWVADLLCHCQGILLAFDNTVGSRRRGNPRLLCQ